LYDAGKRLVMKAGSPFFAIYRFLTSGIEVYPMDSVPGIIVARGDTEADVYDMCRAYGGLIADKILGVGEGAWSTGF
jgi:hypothetical protein